MANQRDEIRPLRQAGARARVNWGALLSKLKFIDETTTKSV